MIFALYHIPITTTRIWGTNNCWSLFQCCAACDCIMHISVCTSLVFAICLQLYATSSLVTKRRLCVQYKKENYLLMNEYITESHVDTEDKCMVHCVRHNTCMAFNYHILNKTCFLLPDGLHCLQPRSNNTSYLFVQLQPCKLQPVWLSLRPPDHNWHWIETSDPSYTAGTVKSTGVFSRYVARSLYQGRYLLGWWRDDAHAFRLADPFTQQAIKCPKGEFLVFPVSSSYVWTPYTAGDVLPDNALPVSQTTDGSPLYTVSYLYNPSIGTDRIFGFYNHHTRSTYVPLGSMIHPTKVNILCVID